MAIATLFRNFGRRIQQSFPRVLRAPKQIHYISGLGSVSSYKAHMRHIGGGAARSAYTMLDGFDRRTRNQAAKEAAGHAIGKQTLFALEILRRKGTAERANIRAKYGVKLAQLKVRQAVRDHGPDSAAAAGARYGLREARKVAIIAGERLARHDDVF